MKKTYLEQLTAAVRWRLPAGEAREVLADYEELIRDGGEPLRQGLGTPTQAARDLGGGTQYRRWLAVFAVLAACILYPAAGLFCWDQHEQLAALLWAVGIALSLVWFLRTDRGRRGALPKGILPLLLLQLLLACAAGAVLYAFAFHALPALTGSVPPGNIGELVTWAFRIAGGGAALPGLYGLLRARLDDRRWRALYTCGLTVALLCVNVLSILHSMDLTRTGDMWWQPHAEYSAILAAAGLAATGVSLC